MKIKWWNNYGRVNGKNMFYISRSGWLGAFSLTCYIGMEKDIYHDLSEDSLMQKAQTILDEWVKGER